MTVNITNCYKQFRSDGKRNEFIEYYLSFDYLGIEGDIKWINDISKDGIEYVDNKYPHNWEEIEQYINNWYIENKESFELI